MEYGKGKQLQIPHLTKWLSDQWLCIFSVSLLRKNVYMEIGMQWIMETEG